MGKELAPIKYKSPNGQRQPRKRYAQAERTPESRQEEYLKKYGLTPELFQQLAESQGHKCAICRADKPGGSGSWHIDHNHACCSTQKKSCGKCIRGLLCATCNIGLGMFKDTPDLLNAAMNYLSARNGQ